MAIISDATKIDKSFKFVNGKGYTTTNKGVDNEDAPSGFIIGTSSIFSQDAGIPTTAPGASTAILTFYGAASPARFKMVYDLSSPLNKAWYASTDGSSLANMRSSRIPNWVPPTFGNYTIRLFLTVGSSTSAAPLTEIFFSDSTAPLFDYKTGILTFESDPLAAYASLPGGPPDGIQISGYVYTGPLLSQVFDGNGNFTGGLSDVGTSASLAAFINPNKSLEISSPFALPTTWISEATPYGNGIAWTAAGQFSDGQCVIAGTSGAIAYSWGHGIWREATSIPTLGTSTSMWCGPDDLTAYVCDSAGRIVKSTDSGRNWTSLVTLGFTIHAIWGSSLTDIFVVGNVGNIVHSTNGTTFSAQTNADTHNLFGVWGSSSSDIFAVGTSGTILHSIGTGTWTTQTSGTSNDLSSVFGFSSTEVYAGGATGTLLKSTSGTWASFNTGIPSTFTTTGLYGVSSGSTKKLYATGFDTSSNNYKVYVSSGTNSWTLEATYTGPESQNFNIAGGTSGIFGGLDTGRVAMLHKNPIEIIHGHSRLDGYVNVHGSLNAKNADLITLNIAPPPPTGTLGTPAITISPLTAVNYTVLSSFTSDSGEGFRFWRESSSVYTLDVGSKVTTSNDGSTPFAAGGRIRLGGFTTSPSTTARGEIETVSSVGLKIAAYQGDLTIANLFGVSGTTKGDINLTTQNGAIRLTAVGTENPYPAGQVEIVPATSAYVVLSTNTTSTAFRTQSPSGNYNVMDGTGSFSNNGSITSGTTISSGTSITAGTSVTSTTLMTAGTTLKAAGGITTGTLSPTWTGSNHKIEAQGDIHAIGAYNIITDSGNITATTGILTAGNYVTSATAVYAGTTLIGSNLLRIDAAGTTGGAGVHCGLWMQVTGIGAGVFAAWGMAMSPCPVNTTFAVVSSCSTRLSGVVGTVIYVDVNTAPGNIVVPAFWTGVTNEFMVMIEWEASNGFSYGGRVLIY